MHEADDNQISTIIFKATSLCRGVPGTVVHPGHAVN